MPCATKATSAHSWCTYGWEKPAIANSEPMQCALPEGKILTSKPDSLLPSPTEPCHLQSGLWEPVVLHLSSGVWWRRWRWCWVWRMVLFILLRNTCIFLPSSDGDFLLGKVYCNKQTWGISGQCSKIFPTSPIFFCQSWPPAAIPPWWASQEELGVLKPNKQARIPSHWELLTGAVLLSNLFQMSWVWKAMRQHDPSGFYRGKTTKNTNRESNPFVICVYRVWAYSLASEVGKEHELQKLSFSWQYALS